MGWFMPVDRKRHPCLVPTIHELGEHRIGEYWRCEVCDDLWVLRGGGMSQVGEIRTRWMYRNKGYNTDG